MRTRVLYFLIGALAALAVLSWLPELRRITAPPAEPRAVVPRGDLAPNEQTIIALFESARPSVVAITTAARVFDPFTQRRVEVPRGTGSGFVWDELGHVVTNNHVVEGAQGAQVRLADGRVLPAALVGTDPGHDLAVLRIDASGGALQPLPIGTSADARVGQTVLAIGNPFGLDWTLTTGVISALEREIAGAEGRSITGLIQTDAAINPGNSGGPLIDSAGRLIGVNTAIYSPSGSSAGIGFAVPVDVVNRVVPQLITTGHYRPPVLGVVHDERVNELARAQGMEGVLVLAVEPGSPAAAAGLRPARMAGNGRIVPGDVLVGFDGRRIGRSEELRQAIEARDPGDEVALTVLRDGREQEVAVTLAAP